MVVGALYCSRYSHYNTHPKIKHTYNKHLTIALNLYLISIKLVSEINQHCTKITLNMTFKLYEKVNLKLPLKLPFKLPLKLHFNYLPSIFKLHFKLPFKLTLKLPFNHPSKGP